MAKEFKIYPTSKLVNCEIISQIQLDRLKKTKLAVIEVGAYIGDDVVNLHKKFGGCITIYPIEACPVNYNTLRKRFKRFKKTVKPRNLVISDVDGKVKFFTSKHNRSKSNVSSKANSLYKTFLENKVWAGDCKQLMIQSQTLDTFCNIEGIDCIDFLKLNCEGGEYQIFSKKKLAFLRKTNILDIAIHGKSQEFLTPKFITKKFRINSIIMNHGFKLIYGYNLKHIKYCPINHIRQIWIKSDAPWK